jgi:hypothetical protein
MEATMSNFTGNSWEWYQTPRCDNCGAAIGTAARPPFGFCNSECEAEYNHEGESDEL